MSNATIPFHAEFRELVHKSENSIDFLLADPKLDLLYYEPQLGGHSTLGAFNSPVLYDWLFAHSLAVPEPNVFSMLLIAAVVSAIPTRPPRQRKLADAVI